GLSVHRVVVFDLVHAAKKRHLIALDQESYERPGENIRGPFIHDAAQRSRGPHTVQCGERRYPRQAPNSRTTQVLSEVGEGRITRQCRMQVDSEALRKEAVVVQQSPRTLRPFAALD